MAGDEVLEVSTRMLLEKSGLNPSDAEVRALEEIRTLAVAMAESVRGAIEPDAS